MVSYNSTALGISLAEAFLVSLIVTFVLMPWVREGAAAPSIEAEALGASDEQPKSRSSVL